MKKRNELQGQAAELVLDAEHIMASSDAMASTYAENASERSHPL